MSDLDGRWLALLVAGAAVGAGAVAQRGSLVRVGPRFRSVSREFVVDASVAGRPALWDWQPYEIPEGDPLRREILEDVRGYGLNQNPDGWAEAIRAVRSRFHRTGDVGRDSHRHATATVVFEALVAGYDRHLPIAWSNGSNPHSQSGSAVRTGPRLQPSVTEETRRLARIDYEQARILTYLRFKMKTRSPGLKPKWEHLDPRQRTYLDRGEKEKIERWRPFGALPYGDPLVVTDVVGIRLVFIDRVTLRSPGRTDYRYVVGEGSRRLGGARERDRALVLAAHRMAEIAVEHGIDPGSPSVTGSPVRVGPRIRRIGPASEEASTEGDGSWRAWSAGGGHGDYPAWAQCELAPGRYVTVNEENPGGGVVPTYHVTVDSEERHRIFERVFATWKDALDHCVTIGTPTAPATIYALVFESGSPVRVGPRFGTAGREGATADAARLAQRVEREAARILSHLQLAAKARSPGLASRFEWERIDETDGGKVTERWSPIGGMPDGDPIVHDPIFDSVGDALSLVYIDRYMWRKRGDWRYAVCVHEEGHGESRQLGEGRQLGVTRTLDEALDLAAHRMAEIAVAYDVDPGRGSAKTGSMVRTGLRLRAASKTTAEEQEARPVLSVELVWRTITDSARLHGVESVHEMQLGDLELALELAIGELKGEPQVRWFLDKVAEGKIPDGIPQRWTPRSVHDAAGRLVKAAGWWASRPPGDSRRKLLEELTQGSVVVSGLEALLAWALDTLKPTQRRLVLERYTRDVGLWDEGGPVDGKSGSPVRVGRRLKAAGEGVLNRAVVRGLVPPFRTDQSPNWIPVRVEVDLLVRLPRMVIVGLPANEVQETIERVRAAIERAGFEYPRARVVVNVAPADIKKKGGWTDLPIAVGILLASDQIPRSWAIQEEVTFVGRFASAEEQYDFNQGPDWIQSPSEPIPTAVPGGRIVASRPVATPIGWSFTDLTYLTGIGGLMRRLGTRL